MSPISSNKSSADSGTLSVLPGTGAARKGVPSKVAKPVKKKALVKITKRLESKSSTSTAENGAGSKPKGRTSSQSGSGTPTKIQRRQSSSSKREGKGESDLEDSGSEADLEELYEITYVEDYMDAIELVDDLARNNSQLLQAHCEQIGLLAQIENEMSKLLGTDENSGDGTVLDFENMNDEKRQAMRTLEDLLVTASRAGDNGVKISDQQKDTIAEKLHVLRVDDKNLTEERAMRDPDTPKDAHRSKHVKKPSINPSSKMRETPTKLSLSSKDNDNNNSSDVPKPTIPFPLSVAGNASPALSFASSGSLEQKPHSIFDNLTYLDDTRYRTCKYKNVPMYVFPARTSNSNTSTPKKSQQNSQTPAKSTPSSKPDKEESDKGTEEPTASRKRSLSSQSSISKCDQDGASNKSDNGDSSSSDSDEPTYCLCEKESHGRMVQCDNELCPIEWFHFRCVNLKKIPKGDWYCPRCRGDNSTTMKSKTEFLKELDEYNKKKAEESCEKKQS